MFVEQIIRANDPFARLGDIYWDASSGFGQVDV